MDDYIEASGYFQDDELTKFDVIIGRGTWDENDDDDHVFWYADNAAVHVGDVIADNFVITEIYN